MPLTIMTTMMMMQPSSSSDHSTIGDGSGGASNDDYEDNDDVMPPMAMKVPFVMAPIAKRTTPHCHVLTSPFSQNFLHQSLPHLFARGNHEWNAHSKVKSYNIGEEPSDGENKCSISDERVSSVGGSS